MNPIFSELDESATLFEQQYPKHWKLVYPRRYVPPLGYANPKWNATMLAAHLEFMDRKVINKVEVDCILAAWQICQNLVPVYFVANDFLEALTNTEPPENLTVRELHWPFDGMVFCLPEQFQKKYFDFVIPWLRIARFPSGLQDPPPRIQEAFPNSRACGIKATDYDDMGFLLNFTVMFGNNPVDYSASFSDRESVSQMMNDQRYKDFCITPEDAKEMAIIAGTNIEEDQQMLKKAIALAAHLLLAMNAVPEQIEPPVCVRPAKVKKGIAVKQELWAPQFFGRRFIWQREKTEPVGTHASPRMHPRRGHWRHQKVGVGRAAIKIIWIKPMLIGAKGE